MTIYKYPLTVTDEQELNIQADARILCCQMQGGHPCLWALVDPSARMTKRKIFIVGTGNKVPERTIYIGTVQMLSGALVWHVFEEAA